MLSLFRQLTAPLFRVLLLAFVATSLCSASDFSDWEQSLVAALAEGRQSHAETIAQKKTKEIARKIKALPKNSSEIEPLKKEFSKAAFWNGVLCRSRFNIEGSMALFAATIDAAPNSLEAKTAANILGIDLAKNKQTAFYFFNSLIALAEQNPRSVPILWLTGILSRSLTGDQYAFQPSITEPEIFHIRNCGVRHYEKLLKKFAPGPGPVLVHQTLANLLNDLQCNDLALAHRETALQMERRPWVLHGIGLEHRTMGNYEEAIRFFQEAIGRSEGAPPAYYYKDLGNTFWDQRRYAEALQAWDHSALISPSCSGFWSSYISACRLLGDYPRAWNLMKKVCQAQPDNAEAKVVESRMAALCGDLNATAKQKEAGDFNFNGRVIKDEGEGEGGNLWCEAISYGKTKAFFSMVDTQDLEATFHSYQQTPLMLAAQKGWMPILRELIRRGVSLDTIDANKDTALHYAAQFRSPEAVAALVEAGASLNLQDKWKQTPLIMCMGNDNREGARILLANGADPTLSTGHGGAAINYAAGYGEVEMIKTMLQKGSDPSAGTGRRKRTPIMAACGEYQHQAVLPILLEAGADINAVDQNGNTALHLATNPLLNRPLIYFLLDNGADPTQPNAAGIPAITQARLLGYDEIALQMEKAAGTEIPFVFPKIQDPQTDDPTDQAAALIVNPILLAQGNPAGTVAAEQSKDKHEARKELARMFGISSKKQLEDTVDQLLEFHPQIQEASLQIAEVNDTEKLLRLLTDYAKASHKDTGANTNEKAWVLAHIIYLADLGVSAEMLTHEEADTLIEEMVGTAKKSFASWQQFYESFLLGTKHLCGWERERYTNICRRLEEQKLPWIR